MRTIFFLLLVVQLANGLCLVGEGEWGPCICGYREREVTTTDGWWWIQYNCHTTVEREWCGPPCLIDDLKEEGAKQSAAPIAHSNGSYSGILIAGCALVAVAAIVMAFKKLKANTNSRPADFDGQELMLSNSEQEECQV
eukprot:TRINITY_DN9381_c0_g1_i1.p1 TRINITY_DN9381_c0_g1~~TRINITY_DN9381_c0_g1_i1.p1  ORF type:complete len:139 (+),score=18.59 TRINITY_DN9381_c0_g1_i1:66-482(+)